MSNITKNIDVFSKKGITPGAFSIKEIIYMNHRGDEFAIHPIVTKITVTESVYSTSLVCRIMVRDASNLLENFDVIGQEKIRIRITKAGEDGAEEESEFDQTFYITEYPQYGRGREKHVQAYEIVGISEHAYISKFKKISRAVSDKTTSLIQNIFTNDLKTNRLKLETSAYSRFKGLINIQEPLSAIEWLRRKSFDYYQSPFYLFETLNGDIRCVSQADLTRKFTYRKFYADKEFNYAPWSKEDFLQRKDRILEISSDLNLGKIFQGVSGAFSSENFSLDIANKTFTSKVFNYDNKLFNNTMCKKTAISNDFLIDSDPINKLSDARHEYISTNTLAFDGEQEFNYNDMYKTTAGVTRAYLENFETISHEIKLHGDFKLNAGTIIDLKFPKAIEPAVQSDVIKGEAGYGRFDELLSGRYMITSAIHEFEEGEYFVNVKVKRDSYNLDIYRE